MERGLSWGRRWSTRYLAPTAAILAGIAGSIGALPAAGAILVEALYALTLRIRVRRVVGTVDAPGRDLKLFAELLARVGLARRNAGREREVLALKREMIAVAPALMERIRFL